MTDARYEELLAQLLDGILSDDAAGELAQELERNPDRRRDVRQHLALWELWEHTQASERGADAFVAAWRTRLRAESEAPGAFSASVWARVRRNAIGTRMATDFRWWTAALGAAGLAATALVLFWLLAPKTSLATIRVQGEAVCTACILHESDEHRPALRVTEGGRTHIIYLDASAAIEGQQWHFCTGPTAVTVEGQRHIEGGREHLTPSEVSFRNP